MTCVGESARVLLDDTHFNVLRADSADKLREIWAEFEVACRAMILQAEERYRLVEDRCDGLRNDLREAERDLQEVRYIKTEELSLCDRIMQGELKLDDYMVANKRGWPLERLEQLAGRR